MKIIYCQCGVKTEIQKGEAKECKCGKVFGVKSNKILRKGQHATLRGGSSLRGIKFT